MALIDLWSKSETDVHIISYQTAQNQMRDFISNRMSQNIKRQMNNLDGTSHNQRWCHRPSASVCASRVGAGGKRREGVLQLISLPRLQLGLILRLVMLGLSNLDMVVVVGV